MYNNSELTISGWIHLWADKINIHDFIQHHVKRNLPGFLKNLVFFGIPEISID